MDKPALFFNDIYIYWHGIFMMLAICAAIAAAMLMSALWQRKKALMLFDTILLSFPFGFVLSRALYCASNYEEFKSPIEILKFSDGGYALYGAILGAFLAARTLKKWRGNYPFGAVSDCMAAGGALGIVIGRLAAYFSFDNVGIEMTDIKYQFSPLCVYNETKDIWAVAVFNMEALAEFAIFIVLCVMFSRNNNEKKRRLGKDGDIALLFLMLHGAFEVVFDSMQMDALKFPGNSFVRIQEIIGVLCLAAVMAIFVIRSVKRDKFMLYHLLSIALFCVMIGIAAYMQLVNRISDTNYFRNHAVMLIAMLCDSVLGTVMYITTLRRKRPVSH